MGRKHTFVNFSDRVAAIRIDPVRRTSQKRNAPDSADNESFFIAALDRWNELNMASHYTKFSQSCRPLSKSLPMVLHNEEKIFELLNNALIISDKYSAESLMDLLVHFARDLGEDFEQFYPKALETCIDIISRNQKDDESLEIVEYAFNALAHLFKYLSRLLTTNLVPTYDLLLPLFGGVKQSKQRSFVLRFAAESLGFLIRRCGDESFRHIVDYIVNKVARDVSNEQYVHSSAQLLASTLKGPQTTLHSKTPKLIQGYFSSCHKFNVVDLFCQIIVEALHHCRLETAGQILSATLDCISDAKDAFAARCLYAISGLRKGDRIEDWNPCYDSLLLLAPYCGTHLSWSQAAVSIFSYADALTTSKRLKSVLESIEDLPTLCRCMLTLEAASPNVFSTHRTELWKAAYSKCHFNKTEDLKLIALLCLDLGTPESVQIPKARHSIDWKSIDANVSKVDSLFELWWQSMSQEFEPKVVDLQLSSLLSLPEDLPSGQKAFKSVVIAKLLTFTTREVSQQHIHQLSNLPPHPHLLDAIRKLVSQNLIGKTNGLEAFSSQLIACMNTCDAQLRGSALQLLRELSKPEDDPEFLLDQCAVINSLPLNLENARNISQRLRNLASKYKLTDKEAHGSKAIAQATLGFFFGMLTSRLQPVWNEVLRMIPSLSESSPQEVCALAMSFVENPKPIYSSDLSFEADEAMSETIMPEFNELDCHSLATLQSLCEQSWYDVDTVTTTLQNRARKTLKLNHIDDMRAFGIRVLCEIPQLAESFAAKVLVSYLLQTEEEDDEFEPKETQGSFGSESESEAQVPFTFSDKLLLLELFGKFRHVDKLPEFPSLYQRYLYFLASRHAPFQRTGLKCILAVSNSDTKVLRKYRSNFDALLDDKRFRDELVSFVCASEDATDEASLHSEDENTVMPYIIRILYGRAQNSTKRNMRYAVLSSLHSLEPKYLVMFVSLAQSHLAHSNLVNMDSSFAEKSVSRKVQGYLSLVNDFVGHLKTRSEPCLTPIMEQGIFPILRKLRLDEDSTLRQLVTKNLEEFIVSVPKLSVWNSFYPEIYDLLIEPQLKTFSLKNRETSSTLLRLLVAISKEPELSHLLNDQIGAAVTSCLSDSRLKEPVIDLVLNFVINLTKHVPRSQTTEVAIANTLQHLPSLMERDLPVECFLTAIETINQIFSLGLGSFDESIIESLAETCFAALQKPSRLIPLPAKGSLLFALSKILDDKSCSMDIIKEAYTKLAPLFKQFVSRDHRLHLSSCYEVFGRRSEEYKRVGSLIVELNSFDKERLGEPDFARRSAAFEKINETLWTDLSQSEWLPLMFNNLFFMRDPEELALRNNGKYAIMRLIESQKAPDLVEGHILPAIKRGLRDSDDKFRRLYIDLLRQCASFDILPSLQILLYQGDEEADFFININHVQVHRRRRALQRLARHADKLEDFVIAHYLLSIVENFALLSGSKNGDLNNLADDALSCMTELLKHVSAGQFKSVARRRVQDLLQNPEPAKLRKHTRVVTSIAQATPQGVDDFVVNVLVSPLQRFLSAKNNEHENLPDRVPLAVAMAYFLKPLNKTVLESQLPGKLTPLCHLLRSKIPEMRDTVRQSLGKVARILGPRYLYFIVTELFGALRKGGLQSHVLGFTVHSVLVELNRSDNLEPLQVGAMDDSAGIIFRIVMNDTFGSVGEEKDSENYATSAKEVKQHKSYDTAEILATWTSLAQFGRIIEPIRDYLCSTKLSSKGEHKIEDVLRRLSAGLHKNTQASSQDSVVMAYEVFTSSSRVTEKSIESQNPSNSKGALNEALVAREEAKRESERFFTVRLSSRDWYESSSTLNSKEIEFAKKTRYAPTNLHLLQSFALETLRSVMTSTSGGATKEGGGGLLTVSNVKGLIPVILAGLESRYEDVNMSALRFATTAMRLPVPFSDSDSTLDEMGTRTLSFIESSPDTNSLICQAAFKFLTMLLRSKPEFEIKSGSIAYILERLKPDLDEPERQGTAVSLVRAIFQRQIMLPQVYDIADSLSKILVTNQSQHIRVNCRAAYLQFLTTYPLGQSRLDRHLSSLGANLQYAAPAGRLSAMEMIQSLLSKININQLESAFVQFYSALAFISVTDSEPECRQRALSLIKDLINHVESPEVLQEMIELCQQWLSNLGKNDLLVRGGLEISSLLKGQPGTDILVKLLSEVVTNILIAGQRSSQKDVDWQLVYLSLDNEIDDKLELVAGVLLFPHPWVRAKAARIFGNLFKSSNPDKLSLELVTDVGYKLLRQLGAPRLSSSDGLQIVKNLVFILPIWESKSTTMSLIRKREGNSQKSGEEPGDQLCIDWAISRLNSTIKTNVSAEDFVGSKTAAIQILAALSSQLSKSYIENMAYEVIVSLFVLSDQLSREDAHSELQELAQDALSLYETTLGTTEYLKRYTKAERFVRDRRNDRKAKRSIEAVADPELYAQKKMKRNAHKHEARKLKKHRANA